MKYCFGADVGGTTIKLGLFTVDGEILDKWEIITRTENEGESILQDIATALKEKIQEKAIPAEEVIGIGMGIPAPVNSEGIVRKTANLGWGYKEVTKELTELTGLPSKGGNDANVAALGEMWKGAAAGHKSGVMVTLGTGVGGGVIINGKIITGAHGAGGEIGHIHVDDEVPGACGCGNHGCLEHVASANGIVRLAKWMLEQNAVKTVLDPETMSAREIWDAVKDGDTFACEVAERFGKYLGLALSAVAGTADPEVFVIGGGMSRAGQIVIDYIQKYYVKYVFRGCRDAEFILASLGNNAGMYGAAKLVIEE